MAAGITYVPPLLLEAGVEERYMTMVLGKGLVGTERAALQCMCVNASEHVLPQPHSFKHIFMVSSFPSLSFSDKIFIKHERHLHTF